MSSMSPYAQGFASGKSEGLLMALEGILSKFSENLEKRVVANSIVWTIRKSGLMELVIDELDLRHLFHEIWLEEPIRVIEFYGYEKKYIRGPSNHVLKFDHKASYLFDGLRHKLEVLQRQNDPKHCLDNKIVYIYEIVNGRKIAVMFKDGNTVFGNTWNVQDYYGR